MMEQQIEKEKNFQKLERTKELNKAIFLIMRLIITAEKSNEKPEVSFVSTEFLDEITETLMRIFPKEFDMALDEFEKFKSGFDKKAPVHIKKKNIFSKIFK